MNQLKAILILVVCGLYSAYANDKCAEDGYHVVEDDCSRYYRCANGQRFDFECNDGLKFHTKLEVCVWGNQVDCEAKPRPTTEATPTTTKKPSEPTADCPLGDGHFVDEEDCSRFYVCSDGARQYSNCDNDLFFDTVSKTCSPKENAKCTN